MQPSRNRFMIWTVLLVLAVGRLMAQNATGSIVGHVKDPSGAAVAAAEVSVTNTDTHEVRTTSTNNSGDYTVPVLQPGHYQVSLTAKGFKSETESLFNSTLGLGYALDQPGTFSRSRAHSR